MTSRLRIFATVFALLVAASSLAGCSFEPGERTQLVGQECFNDDQCVTGAVCVQRRCQYEGHAQVGDAGTPDADVDADADAADVFPSDVPDYQGAPATDAGGAVNNGQAEVCRAGARRCTSDTELEFCRDDGTGFESRTCEGGRSCEEGVCVGIDPSVCRAQYQRCDQEGQNNGYYCGDVFRSGELRCIGMCRSSADDPDSTCPDANSKCFAIDGEDEIGLCMSKCSADQGCDTPGFECDRGFISDDGGVCLPSEF